MHFAVKWHVFPHSDDFTPPSDTSVIFTPESSEGDEQCVQIGIIDDDDLEGDETYMVSIESISQPIANGTGNAALFTIQDNLGILSCFSSALQ